MKKKLVTTHSALIAVWAAVIAVSTLLPAFPVIGTGATLSVGDAIVVLGGILFGPWAGGIAAGVGGFIGQLIAPHGNIFGPLQFTIGIAAAVASGLAMQRKWGYPMLAWLFFGGVWYLFPLGREAWATPILYLLGVFACIVGWIWGKNWLISKNRGTMFFGIFVCALIGVLIAQSNGNLWALVMFALPAPIWFSVLLISPVERIGFGLIAAAIGTPLLIGLPKISVPVGPALAEQEADEDDTWEDED